MEGTREGIGEGTREGTREGTKEGIRERSKHRHPLVLYIKINLMNHEYIPNGVQWV